THLSLGDSNLVGSYPALLSNLTQLVYLDLSYNNFTGTLELDKLLKSKELSSLDLSNNNLSVSFENSKNHSFPNLQDLGLSSCNVSEFPHFLRSSNQLFSLDLSYNQIRGRVPKWLWEVGKNSLYNLNLSHNLLTYIEPLPWNNLEYLDLRSNLFSGPLPIASPILQFLSVSKNQLVGEIPTSFCSMSSLEVLDLSHNNLSGIIPQCMGNFSKRLSVLDLHGNKLHGTVRTTFAKGNSLRNLDLNSNHLDGPLPRSLVYCRNLEVLDLGNNLLNDTFPDWLETLPKLRVLVLKSNRLYESIGNSKTRNPFRELRIMDLSNNEFSGILPTKYFENFKAMMNAEKVNMTYMGEYYYQDSVMVTMKGLDIELVKIQTIFTSLDFSRNNFTGEIPELIGMLKSLKGLNFSHNMLRGPIPSSLGNLTNLEWLDLSSNELVGKIPPQLTDLSWLQILNLSQNQLVGPIPLGKQFNTFSNDSFSGNFDLCGLPLSKTCNEVQNSSPPTLEQENNSEDASGFTWKVVLMGYGCGLVFGILMGYIKFFSNRRLIY
ncbi:LRR domain containing protein, partial [Parasponia andersonii]